MTFDEWLIENNHNQGEEYIHQNMYSVSEWDELYEQYINDGGNYEKA